jgi:hypothetical protein
MRAKNYGGARVEFVRCEQMEGALKAAKGVPYRRKEKADSSGLKA